MATKKNQTTKRSKSKTLQEIDGDDGTQMEQKPRKGGAMRSKVLQARKGEKTAEGGENYAKMMKLFCMETAKTGVAKLAKDFTDTRVVSLKSEIPRTAFDANMGKNRYKDVICSDEGRVALSWPPGNPNDYVHANWVPVKGEKKYICTQGPTEKTVEDFWRLVWQEKCKSIVMLCGVMEMGKKKCEQYWPHKEGEMMTSGQVTITNTKVIEVEKNMICSSLDLAHQGEVLKVDQIHWNGWPDRGVPENYLAPMRLIRKVTPMTPILVHCSAGIGRTGTVVGLDMCQHLLNAGEKIDMHEIVKELRKHRHGSVQTDVQFVYMHRVLFAIAENKKIITREEFAGFFKEFDAFVKAKGG